MSTTGKNSADMGAEENKRTENHLKEIPTSRTQPEWLQEILDADRQSVRDAIEAGRVLHEGTRAIVREGNAQIVETIKESATATSGVIKVAHTKCMEQHEKTHQKLDLLANAGKVTLLGIALSIIGGVVMALGANAAFSAAGTVFATRLFLDTVAFIMGFAVVFWLVGELSVNRSSSPAHEEVDTEDGAEPSGGTDVK